MTDQKFIQYIIENIRPFEFSKHKMGYIICDGIYKPPTAEDNQNRARIEQESRDKYNILFLKFQSLSNMGELQLDELNYIFQFLAHPEAPNFYQSWSDLSFSSSITYGNIEYKLRTSEELKILAEKVKAWEEFEKKFNLVVEELKNRPLLTWDSSNKHDKIAKSWKGSNALKDVQYYITTNLTNKINLWTAWEAHNEKTGERKNYLVWRHDKLASLEDAMDLCEAIEQGK